MDIAERRAGEAVSETEEVVIELTTVGAEKSLETRMSNYESLAIHAQRENLYELLCKYTISPRFNEGSSVSV